MKPTDRLTVATLLGRTGKTVEVPRGGWLRAVREAKGVRQTELAAKLGFKRQAWAQFEASEAREAISLASLRRAADVLGCDVTYFVIPRKAGSLKTERSALSGRPGSRRTRATDPAGTTKLLTAPTTAGRSDAEIPAWSESELPTELR